MRRLILTLILCSLFGCGHLDHKKVEYDITCSRVECDHADRSEMHVNGLSGTKTLTCEWDDVCYRNACHQYVKIVFTRDPGQCWQREHETVRHGFESDQNER